MLAISIPGEWSALDPRLSTSPPNILISHGRGANGVQWHSNVSIVFNELSIVTGETQTASDILTIFRLRPIHYLMCGMFVGVDAVLLDVKAATIDILTCPGTFYMLGFQTMFRQ